MATSVDRIFGYSSLSAFRLPVRVATTANITLSGEQTVDGVSVVAGDRVLVKDQTDGTENGVYVAATGAWTRAEDFDGARDVVEGTMVLCNNGSTQAGTIFRLTSSSPVIGSTSLTFASVITIGESGLQVGIDIQGYATILQTLATAGTLPTVTVTDLNDATADSFIYAGAGAANAPSGLSASAINGIVSAQGTDDLVQLIFGQSVTRLYMRAKNDGVWSSWERFLRFSDVLDEDDLGGETPDENMPPSQQSVAAYVGLAKISETTISSDATIDLTLDTATYRSFMIKISNVVPETDTVDLLMRTSSDAGSTFDSGASDYANVATGQSPTTDEAVYLTLTSDIGSAAGEDGLSGIITIHDPGDATTKTKATYNVTFINSGGSLTSRTGGGMRATAEANDAIRFLMSSGNLESGKITLYGMK